MRDTETTKIGIEASLTGHLVFSTLHTNSAAETISRLIEMGLDPYNFADALLGILAQRLARRLCPNCKTPYLPERSEYDEIRTVYGEKWFEQHNLQMYSEAISLFRAGSCKKCNHSGYKGRIALHELLVGSKTIKKAIKQEKFADEIAEMALSEGMATLKMDGIQKVLGGLTDLAQVMRVCI